MNEKILVVDDEADLREVLSLSLEQEGYLVRTVTSGAEAVTAVKTDLPDLILMDLILEDVSGTELTARFKADPKTQHIPIIMLTAKDTETDIVVGLKMGADDYITKPFRTAVLLARVETILRRNRGLNDRVQEVFSADGVVLQVSARRVKAEGREVDLTEGEFNILLAIMKAAGEIVSRPELKECLGENATGQQERIVDVHVASIRKKLGEHRKIIKTVHGRGYRIAT